MSRQIVMRLGLLASGLVVVSSVAYSQGRGGQQRGLEVLSKTMQMSSTEFIQIPGPNPLLTPSPSGWDVMYNETADIFKDDETYYLYYHGFEDGYQVGVATADHPLGPWTKYEKNPIIKLGAKGSWEHAFKFALTLVGLEKWE
jgi:beta-xylosidase